MSQVLKPKKGYKLVKWFFGKKIEIPDGWEIKRLLELSEKKNDIVAGPFGSNLKVSDYRSEGVPIIRLQNIERNKFVNKNIKFISNEKAEELAYHSYLPNDLVLAKLGDPIGKTCKIPEDFLGGIVVADVVRIRTSSKKSNQDFVEYVLNSKICEKQHNKEKIGTTRPRVNLDQIRNLQFPTPSPQEQQKIATILSNIDNLITNTQKIIDQTKLLKKGLMQKLLTRGIGHRKFKKVTMGLRYMVEEFPKEWEITTLGKNCNLERGKFGHRPRDDPEYYGGKYPFIQTGDVEKSNGYIRTFSQTLNEKGLKVSKIFPKGVIVITIAANIGTTSITTFPVCFPDSLIGISTDVMDIRFLEYYLRTRKKYLNVVATESAQKNINYETLKPLQIPNPPLKEQQQIATILSNVDSQIQSQTQYREKLEKLKKSLMQKLLTGEVRVKT